MFEILLRDLRARVRDRSAILIGLVAPLALITVLSLVISGPTVERRPVGLVLGGDTAVNTAVRAGALDPLARQGVIRVREFPNREAARRAVEKDDVDAAIVTSQGRVEVLRGTHPVGAGIAESASRSAAGYVDAVRRTIAAETVLGRPATSSTVRQTVADLVRTPSPLQLADRADAVKGIDAKTQIASGMATFFLFFTVQFGVLSLLEERRSGTLARLLAAPIAPWQVLFAKVLLSFVLGILSMGVLIVASRVLLGTQWGNPVGVALLAVCGVLAATATCTLVMGVVRNPETAGLAQSMVAIVLGILGGAFFSMARAGGVSAALARLTPHHWFQEGLVRLTGGASWTAALGPCAAMLLFAAVVGVPGVLFARRRMRR